MLSASKAELGAILTTEKELAPMIQTLIDMGWPHPPTPINKDNSKAAGVANDTIIVKKTKSTELRLHWLRCHKA